MQKMILIPCLRVLYHSHPCLWDVILPHCLRNDARAPVLFTYSQKHRAAGGLATYFDASRRSTNVTTHLGFIQHPAVNLIDCKRLYTQYMAIQIYTTRKSIISCRYSFTSLCLTCSCCCFVVAVPAVVAVIFPPLYSYFYSCYQFLFLFLFLLSFIFVNPLLYWSYSSGSCGSVTISCFPHISRARALPFPMPRIHQSCVLPVRPTFPTPPVRFYLFFLPFTAFVSFSFLAFPHHFPVSAACVRVTLDARCCGAHLRQLLSLLYVGLLVFYFYVDFLLFRFIIITISFYFIFCQRAERKRVRQAFGQTTSSSRRDGQRSWQTSFVALYIRLIALARQHIHRADQETRHVKKFTSCGRSSWMRTR